MFIMVDKNWDGYFDFLEFIKLFKMGEKVMKKNKLKFDEF